MKWSPTRSVNTGARASVTCRFHDQGLPTPWQFHLTHLSALSHVPVTVKHWVPYERIGFCTVPRRSAL